MKTIEAIELMQSFTRLEIEVLPIQPSDPEWVGIRIGQDERFIVYTLDKELERDKLYDITRNAVNFWADVYLMWSRPKGVE